MDIKPIGKIDKPKYPVKQEVSAKTLRVAVPVRWSKSAAAKIALGALAAMTLAGCDMVPTNGVPIPADTPSDYTVQNVQTPTPKPTPLIDDYELAGEPMMPTIIAAPLFIHGEGRGSMGCVMIAPPVFLSEHEALEVINEVAADYGISFAQGDELPIYSVLQPVTNIYESGNNVQPDTYEDMAPDFADQDKGIAIEYVSVEDVQNWHKDSGVECSVESYNTKDAAQQLRHGLSWAYTDYGDTIAGVLYDPCANFEDEQMAMEDPEKSQERTRETSVANLKAQVVDFFAWLKREGII